MARALYAHPPVDPYLNTALAFARLARAGVSSVMHVHSSILVDQLPDHAERIARAARDVGIRLAFVVPLRDQNTMGLEEDQAMLARHDERDRELIRRTWLYPWPSPRAYVDLVRDIARRIEGPTVSVQYGPNSPQACSDALIAAIAEASAADGRRITTHLHETKQQQEWGDAKFREGFMRHYDALGLFSERFTGAHGIWLRPADVDLMAERGASVAVNMSSNFRLRSGIAPVGDYIRAGMRFAFGIDAFSIDDDDDAFRELRMVHWLHSPSTPSIRSPPRGCSTAGSRAATTRSTTRAATVRSRRVRRPISCCSITTRCPTTSSPTASMGWTSCLPAPRTATSIG